MPVGWVHLKDGLCAILGMRQKLKSMRSMGIDQDKNRTPNNPKNSFFSEESAFHANVYTDLRLIPINSAVSS